MADGGGLSLREALILANAMDGADTITFDALLSGATIVLDGTELSIASDVTIDGDIDGDDKADITIDAAGGSRVFNVTDGTSTLDALAITGGDAGSGSQDFGGGIRVENAALTIANAVVTGNNADTGAGGGIALSTDATLTTTNTVISDNAAAIGAGVAMGGHNATATFLDTTISGNSATGFGGGVVLSAPYVSVTLVNSTVSDNSANGGAGIDVGAPYVTLTLTNSTVSGNVSESWGGGIGIGGPDSIVTLTNTTVSGNSAATFGGGMTAGYGGPTTLANSLIAGNEAGHTGSDVYAGAVASVSYSGGNIVGDTLTVDGVVQQTGIALTDIFAEVGTNDIGVTSGVLADNGGPVETIALNRDSANPAIDVGDADALVEATAGVDLNGDGDTDDTITTDARGLDRDVDFDAVGGTPDLGAFEVQNDAELVVTTLLDTGDDFTVTGDLAAEMADGGGLSLREALILANADFDGDPTNGTNITFDAGLAGGTVTLSGAKLEIASDIVLDGDIDGDDVADITIDADHASRAFGVDGGTSTIDALTITGGETTASGGGIRIAGGASLAIVNSTVTGNVAQNGAGIEVAQNGTLVVTNTTLSGNNADYGGGGIRNAGNATVIASTLSGNDGTYGGGFYNTGAGAATLTNVTLAGNTAEYGGGLANYGIATLANATLTGNAASKDGGGIYNDGTTVLASSIVAGNEGDTNDEISAASPVTFSGANVIGQTLSQNGVSQQTGIALTDIFAKVDVNDIGVTAGLLADNGGQVETVALNRDLTNPALDAGDASLLDEATFGIDLNGDGDTDDVITTDARGFTRDVDFDGVGGTPDLGAFEAQNNAELVVTTLLDTGDDFTVTGDLAAEMADGGGLSLREAILLANAGVDDDPTNGTSISFDASLAGGTIILDGTQVTVTSDVIIDGDVDGDDKADITVDGNGASRVFQFVNHTSLIDSLVITGGQSGPSGGGVLISANADLTIAHSTISDNTSSSAGGGVFVNGTLTLVNSTVSGNAGTVGGGGIDATGTATIVVINSTVSGNRAGFGGGGIDSSGDVTLVNTTVSGNTSGFNDGGGVALDGVGDLTLVNSIIAGNEGASGGDLYAGPSTTVTYAGGNIVGDTLSTDGGSPQTGIALTDIFASVGANPYTGIDSGVLADYGGPVQTIALDRDVANPAIDSGDATLLDEATLGTDLNGDGDTLDTITTDARGFSRDVDFDGVGGTPDLGAFEALTDTLVVTTLDDSGDNLTVTGTLADEIADGGGLSLREALFFAADIAADPTTGDPTITFDASLTGGSTAGVDDGVLTLTGGELEIASNVTIEGDTDGDDVADITIDADGGSRVFNVTGGTSSLDALVITGGYTTGDGGGIKVDASADLTLTNATVSNNSAYDAGGGLFNAGTVALTNVTLSGNSAYHVTYVPDGYGGGYNYFYGDGGGIYNNGTATLANVTLSGNTAGDNGGGFYNTGIGTATLTNVTLTGNSAMGSGGGFYNEGTATLTDTTLSGNSARYGGGGFDNNGTATLANLVVSGNTAETGAGISTHSGSSSLTLDDSTISGNTASSYGGALYIGSGAATVTNTTLSGNAAGYAGGGIYGGGDTVLTNVTLSGNSANQGGGLYQTSGTVTATNTTITGNSAASKGGGFTVLFADATFANSIVAGNDAPTNGDAHSGSGATVTYSGGNIVGDTLYDDAAAQPGTIALTDIFADVGTNDIGVTAGLLADNGGPVETVALNPDIANPALDAGDGDLLDEATVGIDLNGDGDTDDIIATDARGFDRDVDVPNLDNGGTVDLGATELQADTFEAPSLVVTTLDDVVDAFDGQTSLREALAFANSVDDADGVDGSNDTITFDASLAGGTIILAGTELSIASDVTIDGDIDGDDKADITIDANGGSRVVDVTDGTSTLDALVITGGQSVLGGGLAIQARRRTHGAQHYRVRQRCLQLGWRHLQYRRADPDEFDADREHGDRIRRRTRQLLQRRDAG